MFNWIYGLGEAKAVLEQPEPGTHHEPPATGENPMYLPSLVNSFDLVASFGLVISGSVGDPPVLFFLAASSYLALPSPSRKYINHGHASDPFSHSDGVDVSESMLVPLVSFGLAVYASLWPCHAPRRAVPLQGPVPPVRLVSRPDGHSTDRRCVRARERGDCSTPTQ